MASEGSLMESAALDPFRSLSSAWGGTAHPLPANPAAGAYVRGEDSARALPPRSFCLS